MLTAFGRFCRKLRIDQGELLKDMAEKLGVTPSYLSAVEIGKRSIPKSWPELIKQKYSLSHDQFAELLEAVKLSQSSLKIDLTNYSESDREIMLAFARQFSSLDDNAKQHIKTLLNQQVKKN